MHMLNNEMAKKKLEDLKKREEEEAIYILSQAKYHIPYIDLNSTTIENAALRLLDEKEAREKLMAPFKLMGTTIHVAVHSPEKDGVNETMARLVQKGYKTVVYMASMASLEKAWVRYKELSFAKASATGSLDISPETILELGSRIQTIPDLKILLDELDNEKIRQTSRILEIILAGAISMSASDIHIEPQEKETYMRYRIDGVLENVLTFPSSTFKQLNTRIKLLSGMKITMKSIAQDGRFSIYLPDTEIGIRSSVIPGAYGESIVMRLLDPKAIQVQMEELGIPSNLFMMIEKEIRKPNGLILLTGPTGSGKTTTLYAFLSRIYSTDIKIITIEDPIEYHLEGITQTQVENEKGYTFLEGLRSALRQDPDIIMVGEIRDHDTADTAIESALTGHMVFSTLHTNNAAGVIPRLIDLGISAKTIPSALSLAIAQRLVRKLCTECKTKRPATEEEKNIIDRIVTQAQQEGKDLSLFGSVYTRPDTLFSATGCTHCHMSGYKGRIGIFEAIQVNTKEVEEIIPNYPSEREIKEIAKKQGILDMKEDGVAKVLAGITTLEEVSSVVDVEEE